MYVNGLERAGRGAPVADRADAPVPGDGKAVADLGAAGQVAQHLPVSLLGRAALGAQGLARGRGFRRQPRHGHVRRRLRRGKPLQGGDRVLVHAAGRRCQHGKLGLTVLRCRIGALGQVVTGDNGAVQPVELRFRCRVDGRDQHGYDPVGGVYRDAGAAAAGRIPVPVHLGPAADSGLIGDAERIGCRRLHPVRAHGDGAVSRHQFLHVSRGLIELELAGRDVGVVGRLGDPARAVVADPGRLVPEQVAARAAVVGRRDRERDRRIHQRVAHHGDRRRHRHAGQAGDLVVLGHGDPAIYAGQEVGLDGSGLFFQRRPRPIGPDQDLVSRQEVGRDRADGAQLRGT